MMGQNVENVNKDVDLCDVEVNGMPFHTSRTCMGLRHKTTTMWHHGNMGG
jgi:hypothetical protein